MRPLAAAALVIACATSAATAAAQMPPNPAVDPIFAEWDRGDSPGCAVGAARNGRFVYERGYGMANLDYDVPNGPDIVYYVGSDSKQFTAAAIALLALDGKLSLDDDVRKFLPEMRDYGTPVTVRNLIHHTSGVRDVYALMSLRGDRMEDVFPDSAALDLIFRQKGLGFAPGSAYSYSNSGYYLLAQIVKRVTGQSLREFADARIFAPLGMTHTHFHDDPGHPMKWRAMSYERDGAGAYRISYLQNFDKTGAGGLYTTLGDLLKWDENYYTHQVGGDALRRLIHTRGVLTTGDTLPYAFGNEERTYRGLRTTEHGGSLMGYKAYVLRFPDAHFSVFVTCNLGTIDPGPLAHRVAEVYLGDRMTAPAAATTSVRASSTASDEPARPATDTTLVGTYYSDDLDATWRIVRAPDGSLALQLPRVRATPLVVRGSGYRAGTMGIRFEPGGVMVATVSRIGELRLTRR
ncbi:beta-lactamase [Gemmatirosa kalamazoonensis]|uniref:Beta-lactamase n=1 Tax=Gemmatirosa kalamazoonensis TaxID=861299 RepID=W0RFN2_9BACT|nr:serine hydrolase domain-containing protein [Gemmatirosa kalamazoonensis]AHG89155.1 beta-lactamase [Gemmatirosa kalamazoonensis]